MKILHKYCVCAIVHKKFTLHNHTNIHPVQKFFFPKGTSENEDYRVE